MEDAGIPMWHFGGHDLGRHTSFRSPSLHSCPPQFFLSFRVVGILARKTISDTTRPVLASSGLFPSLYRSHAHSQVFVPVVASSGSVLLLWSKARSFRTYNMFWCLLLLLLSPGSGFIYCAMKCWIHITGSSNILRTTFTCCKSTQIRPSTL